MSAGFRFIDQIGKRLENEFDLIAFQSIHRTQLIFLNQFIWFPLVRKYSYPSFGFLKYNIVTFKQNHFLYDMKSQPALVDFFLKCLPHVFCLFVCFVFVESRKGSLPGLVSTPEIFKKKLNKGSIYRKISLWKKMYF